MCLVEMEEQEMYRIHRKYQLSAAIGMFALCLIATSALWAQGRGFRQSGTGAAATSDPLASLKHALNTAGAIALDASQEAALQSAITNFRNTNRRAAPDSAEKATRDDYNNAILTGNIVVAKTAADKLASVMSMHQQVRMEAEAAFSIQALSVLHNDQMAALQASVGKEGLLRIVASLTGPGGGFGRGMMGRGAMSSRPAGNQR
jgi:hypothetical protein